ncbi:conjugal transfer protein MobC [Chitinophaga sp. S165]|uniref:conjugal transfer protein MobC n=1 Tax=Chitinophaga sp. S165 TaxID=2135462 RepID=UPI000D71754C|nr:conjugal transfer protein MobC [Chitinophaga sp. S165]PWV47114.1 type IV secretory system conjugative DNA transfer VirD4/TraG family protein [Chitinophaga sp. S165]
MQTGENEQGLRAIIDFVRKSSIILLGLHFFIYCYAAFVQWGLVPSIVERVLSNIARAAIFKEPIYTKAAVIGLLALSLLGIKGKKDEKASVSTIIALLVFGMLLFWGAAWLLYFPVPVTQLAIGYMLVTSSGYLLLLSGGARLSRLIKLQLGKDIFNELNETFPQQEELIENEYSVNLRGRYRFKSAQRQMWINIQNPFRGTLLCGSAGAGKTFFVVRSWIEQHISKGYTMFVYDFKFDDLSKIAYNALLQYQGVYKVQPKFYVINFNDLSRSHRCNPLDPDMMTDITDAAEAARTILLGLNRDWVRRQGEFFIESSINFVTAVIWFLRGYQGGKFCTLPHVIEMMSVHYDDLFPVLGTDPQCDVFLNPFISAYLSRAMEQLEGQIASAKIGMARLSSPQLYYVMSGSEFTLDVNNPEAPKIVCMGNDPLKIQIYGAVLSLYISRMLKLVNRKNQHKCSLVFDEYPTIYAPLDTCLATARSNLVSTLLAVQSTEQLRKDYGREQADVIINLPGNVICGQTFGDTAKVLSERFGKIVQLRDSVSINRQDTSVSHNTQLDYAVPPSRISALSSGEFVGMVADNPATPVKLKTFHCQIINDPDTIKAQEAAYEPLPKVREVSFLEVQQNYAQIKNDIAYMIENEIDRIRKDPTLAHLLFIKPEEEGGVS